MKVPIKIGKFALMLLLAAAPGAVAAPQAPAAGNTAGLYRSIPNDETSVIDRTAVMILRGIVQAADDLSRKATGAATGQLNEAIRLIDTLRLNLSTATARNRLAIARLDLRHEPIISVQRDLTQVDTALDEIADYFSVDKARRHVAAARKHLEHGDKGGAAAELTLADRSLEVVEVERPLAEAEQSLIAARRDLARGATGKAAKALQLAIKRVRVISAVVHSPLYLARQSLYRAHQSFLAGKIDEARAYITQAREYLEQASGTTAVWGKERVAVLTGEVRQLEQQLNQHGTATEAVVRSAWEKAKALSERAAAYLDTHWDESETTLTAEDDLLNAKMYLAYAASYQLTMGNAAEAGQELELAATALTRAAKNALIDRATARKIIVMRNQVNTLRTAPPADPAELAARYDRLDAELARQIHNY
ncbi:hypothetical protein GURASL_03930 [Geotalea uraniireducens]|uniref:YfdX protein n=1 Tax=Geotalea uraniireducens TaxID=351604 RepID=A0ABM8EHN3_9BACT|nr:YfdX family protein [Geotalea uraniireducens]BDV41470.1 hypothetical protein GURASL_03930 [Geotalea uraniireducens]